MSEWQPIETAPRDGARFLAIRDEDGFTEIPNIICWNCHYENFADTEWDDARQVKFQPTHWMPLPPAPGKETR